MNDSRQFGESVPEAARAFFAAGCSQLAFHMSRIKRVINLFGVKLAKRGKLFEGAKGSVVSTKAPFETALHQG